jgi:glycosyltransferase involved in cell wall biosynthesis
MPLQTTEAAPGFISNKRDHPLIRQMSGFYQAYRPGRANSLEDINAATDRITGRPAAAEGLRILYVLHNSPFHDDHFIRGGAEYHVLDLIRNSPQNVCFVLYPCKYRRRLLILETLSKGEKIARFQCLLPRSSTFRSLRYPAFARWFAECLRLLRIDAVHIEHWIRMSLDVFDVPTSLGLPLFVTLHDYYALCPNERLLTPQNRFCELVPEFEQCGRCLWRTKRRRLAFLRQWRTEMSRALSAAKQVFAPSGCVRRLTQSIYPHIPITVIPHGLDAKPAAEANIAVRDARSAGQRNKPPDVFRAAILGHLHPVKGSKLLLQMLRANQDDTIEFHSFGKILDQALLKPRLPLISHGPYEREDIVTLLEEASIDLVLILSAIPETFSFTLSEAMLAGRPVLAVDLGAAGDRIREYGCGWLLRPDSPPESILERIQWIRSHPEIYLQVKQAIRKSAHVSGKAMAQIYQKYYQNEL